MPSRLVPGLLGGLLLLTGCGGGDDTEAGTPPDSRSSSTSIPTLSPLPYPEEPPPSGRLIADMRQSSIDVSLGRMQVWIDNDTTHDVTPTRITYRDPRLGRPLLGDNLRTNPAQSERGYPLYLPERPPCPESPGRAESGTLEIRYAGRVDRVPVTDPTDVVGRFLQVRCQELALAEVADIRWSDEVPDDGSGKGAVGTLTLLIRPTGAAGHELVINRVSGSHLLNSPEGPDAWAPDLRVAGDDPPSRLELPMKPSRCDGHAFLEGGNATAFRVAFTLDGEPGEILLRMSPQGMDHALGYARRACGLT
ncbi:MAG: hypothetical protein M3237_00505 [Actinomycetota bacterium]|nr:hypothetical protein [Actinomycetota bacterium]